MERQYIVGISILSLLAVIMSLPLFMVDWNKTGMAFGEYICGDNFCETNETIGNCPQDCHGLCGNGIIENNSLRSDNTTYNEQCDLSNLGGKSCADFSYTAGSLICDTTCSFNFSSCYNSISCNNNTICETGENKTTCSDCECSPGESRQCGLNIGICKPSLQICNLSSKWNICIANITPMNETCNNLDDDCDGETDEGFDWDNDNNIDKDERFDYDKDGYFPNLTLFHNLTCTGYSEYDCNDTDPKIHPYAQERLNDIDDNCNGEIDENITLTNETLKIEKIDLGILKKNGSKAYLRQGDWATFKLGSLFGKVEVKDITDSGATLMVAGISGANINQLPDTPLNLNDIKQFDINNDGKNDISVQLESIQAQFKVTLLIKDISEPLAQPVCNDNNVCEAGETAANCPKDCLVVIYCSKNGVCDADETPESCPSDCKIIESPIQEIPPIKEQQAPPKNWTCNDNTICEQWETKETCPNDCKGFSIKDIIFYAAIAALLLTIASGTIVIKSKSDTYKLKKNIKQNIIKAIDLGYNLNTLNYYLTSQKLKDSEIRKGLKYAGDFMALKQAIVFYLGQGHNENQIKQLCKNNKWSQGIINDVFDDINRHQKIVQMKKQAKPKTNVQKYQIKGI